jgi:hypothetical protein
LSNILDPVPTWAIMLGSALLIFGLSEAGFRLGRRRGLGEGNDPSWLIETTAFTLLALLLGFSFSLALGRYDARRGTLLREANAIGTTFLRAGLLDDKMAESMRLELRAYVAQRLAYARADAAPQQRAIADAKSDDIQSDMWRMAIESAHKDPRSTVVPLFISSLNDTINLETEERAVLTNHIPDVVMFWLLLIAFIAALMMGYGFGRQGRHAVVFKAIFAVMVALVLGLILDLDRPQRGIIRVNLTPLQTVQQTMEIR